VHRDLANSPLGLITDDWIAEHFQTLPSTQLHTAPRCNIRTDLIEELQSADIILIGDPMHNFTISARLKAWLDQVVRFGKTFLSGNPERRGCCLARKGTCSLRVAERTSRYADCTVRFSGTVFAPHPRVYWLDRRHFHTRGKSKQTRIGAGGKSGCNTKHRGCCCGLTLWLQCEAWFGPILNSEKEL